jgi:hypothetical protein
MRALGSSFVVLVTFVMAGCAVSAPARSLPASPRDAAAPPVPQPVTAKGEQNNASVVLPYAERNTAAVALDSTASGDWFAELGIPPQAPAE